MWNFGARVSLMAFVSASSRSTLRSISSKQRAFKARPPTKYVLLYEYVEGVLVSREPFRKKHLQLAKELCISGGPIFALTDTAFPAPTGALFIFESFEKAKAFTDQDPYITGGIVTDYFIKEWTVAIQNF